MRKEFFRLHRDDEEFLKDGDKFNAMMHISAESKVSRLTRIYWEAHHKPHV